MIERFKSGDIRDRAISNGFATEEEIEGMIKGLERWTICDDASMGLVHGELIIHVS